MLLEGRAESSHTLPATSRRGDQRAVRSYVGGQARPSHRACCDTLQSGISTSTFSSHPHPSMLPFFLACWSLERRTLGSSCVA